MHKNPPTDIRWIIEDFTTSSLESHPPPLRMSLASSLTTKLCIQFKLYGSQFQVGSADRGTRKSKPKESIEPQHALGDVSSALLGVPLLVRLQDV
ncbi:hypothetical protein BS47DRAFT_1353357 [Hydnum rufescens UP504]|uniref:Uncharacterized protein n=1 Tax=Hydnum rufescens UP504 TaxID=1448309 RepID=A0A9P6AJM0_9AGAM|nr:hypothetical protein BS47DRAFT_1353357 [Hydnum rufescens UP504]